MASQGMPQPSVKKRRFLLRDLFKACRSISKVLPGEKPNHVNKTAKHDRKLYSDSKRHEEHKFKIPNDPPVFDFQEEKVEGVNLPSRRFNSAKPKSLSRCCSQNTTTDTRSLSYIGRSKSSNNRSNSAVPKLMRSTSSVPHPILYSSSSAKVAKPPPTEKKLNCTLEELCNGCTKKINIKRDVITTSGEKSENEETLEIKVKPGWKEGTKVTFEGKGNETMGNIPADLTFVIVEKEHQVFKREGDDLEMEVEVSLLEALTGYELSVALPDGDNMSLKIEDVIHPGYVTVIQGKGMPIPKEKGKKRGDLRIRFRTKFPQQLTDEQRAEIQSILLLDSLV